MADTPEGQEAPQTGDGNGGAAAADVTPAQAPGNAPGSGQATAPERPPLVVHNQYIKDLSFEAPATPAIFSTLANQAPNIDVNVSVQANALGNDSYEVVLQITSTCKAQDKTAFIAELSYGGVFEVHVAENMLRPVLLIECPRILFPFARHILSNATRDGGFMPLMLGPVDFVALYQRHMQQAQAAQAAAQPQAAQPPVGNA